jgi:ketosteroid isomerase-like protein
MRSRATALVFVLATLAACGGHGTEGQLLQLEREFAATIAAGDVERFESFLAEDVVFLGAEGAIFDGRRAVVEGWSPLITDSSTHLDWKPLRARLSDSGDMGFTYGEWRMTREGDDGSELLGTGRYSTVWQIQADGVWRVVLDVGNADETPRRGLSF